MIVVPRPKWSAFIAPAQHSSFDTLAERRALVPLVKRPRLCAVGDRRIPGFCLKCSTSFLYMPASSS
jgi:hypothetical protein